MAFFGDNNVRTGRVMVLWDGISNPQTQQDGSQKHNIRFAIRQNAPEVQELEQIAQRALAESEYRGQLPPGGNWPLTTVADTAKLTDAVANSLSVGCATQQGVPPIYDDQGNELAPPQWRKMLYPGAIVEVLVHAFAYNNINKGIAFGLDGIMIVDATRPRLPVGAGMSSEKIKEAFTGQPASNSPANYPPVAATSTMPDVTMTAKANGVSLEQFQSQGWTIEQMIEHGYAERKASTTPAAPSAPTAPNHWFNAGPSDDIPF